MVTVDLTPGNHTIKMVKLGYSNFEAVINISLGGVVTCVSVTGGNCNSAYTPGMQISGTTVVGYLAVSGTATPTPTSTPIPTTTPTPTPSVAYSAWITSKGGPAAMKGNLFVIGEIIDGYIDVGSLGFTVSLMNVGTTIDYYLGG